MFKTATFFKNKQRLMVLLYIYLPGKIHQYILFDTTTHAHIHTTHVQETFIHSVEIPHLLR